MVELTPESLMASNFDSAHPTVILAHGDVLNITIMIISIIMIIIMIIVINSIMITPNCDLGSRRQTSLTGVVRIMIMCFMAMLTMFYNHQTSSSDLKHLPLLRLAR